MARFSACLKSLKTLRRKPSRYGLSGSGSAGYGSAAYGKGVRFKRLNKQSTELQSNPRRENARAKSAETSNEIQTSESNPQPSSPKRDFRTLENMAAAPREVSPPPVAAPNPQRPFTQGETDERFETPHFYAVAAACECDLDIVTWRERTNIVVAAVTLAKKYTPEQIALAASRWPHSTAMRPAQLTNEIARLLNQKEPTNGQHNAADHFSRCRHSARRKSRQKSNDLNAKSEPPKSPQETLRAKRMEDATETLIIQMHAEYRTRYRRRSKP